MSLVEALAAEEAKLLTCVHCGFCLPSCPTYVRLGDENDSPRGRLHLMLAVVEGRLDAASPAFQLHIDRCVGCRACETVCPSGVEYGALLELAREKAVRAGGRSWPSRLLLAVFASPSLTSVAMMVSRAMRATGLLALAARVLPSWRWLRVPRLAASMLAASSPWRGLEHASSARPEGSGMEAGDGGASSVAASEGGSGGVAALLLGCVQEGLFRRVNEATRRVLTANGVTIVEAAEQGCCGALHSHGGDLDEARELARRNVDAFEATGAEFVVVNAAGCGAIMKEYGRLLKDDPGYAARATRLAESVRDISEVLADRGPRRGGSVRLTVAADAPCHLLHAQGVARAPAAVLDAVPGLAFVPLSSADECCGGAGLYGITHPDLGDRIGADKVAAVVETRADVVVSGNVGCIMQIGAGLNMAGSACKALHPVELLDESYRRAGFYRADR